MLHLWMSLHPIPQVDIYNYYLVAFWLLALSLPKPGLKDAAEPPKKAEGHSRNYQQGWRTHQNLPTGLRNRPDPRAGGCSRTMVYRGVPKKATLLVFLNMHF